MWEKWPLFKFKAKDLLEVVWFYQIPWLFSLLQYRLSERCWSFCVDPRIKKEMCTALAQWVRLASQIHWGSWLDPWSGHVQESTNECINKQQQVHVSLSSFLSLKISQSIDKGTGAELLLPYVDWAMGYPDICLNVILSVSVRVFEEINLKEQAEYSRLPSLMGTDPIQCPICWIPE